MAAARNYHYSLNAELEPVRMPNGFEFPVVDPDDLAEQYWDPCTKRDRVELIHPEPAAP
ncbi:hypothetical protein OH768_06045 [Streptomyces sp. NBC_01622]|uniref:hypothetical protein n=1 Tax=Streptomyces sp. NBC_01622 TaxID=2975903 RepID=UPI00386D220E|nr:hypothetical protein OH768_06045 [Streptomyces sp. NBC_01622]